MSFDFSTITNGKWILAGEHAVLRGCKAIVFPLRQVNLQLDYQQQPSPCEIHFAGEGEDWHIVLRGVLEKGCALTGRALGDLKGSFHIHNNIPLGVGLGGSAALCVAIARWFHWKSWIAEDAIGEFARQLENLFHRDSSGIDIAGANASHGLIYDRHGVCQPLKQAWTPKWFLSHSGQIGVTSHAVKQVQDLQTSNPELAQQIDSDMQQAVSGCIKALAMDEPQGIAQLLKSINLAKTCFTRWGLTEGKIATHMQRLTDAGAIACKPTGSGNGGYVLSLWTDHPETTDLNLIEIS